MSLSSEFIESWPDFEPQPPENKASGILIDLDGTLFDHEHSLKCAISAIQKKFPVFRQYDTQDLIRKYDESLQVTYDEYLRKEITHEEADTKKVRVFINKLGRPQPNEQEIASFRKIYKSAYQDSRRATRGSIQSLCRLRENGARVAIVTNGEREVQVEKAKAIGVYHLVDKFITSEDAGCCKPDKRIFELAMQALDVTSPERMCMIGDSFESDIMGAHEAQMDPILYWPDKEKEMKHEIFGRSVFTIHSMYMLQWILGFGKYHSCFTPRIYCQDSRGKIKDFGMELFIKDYRIIVEDFGMELCTELLHPMRLTRNVVQSLANHMAAVFKAVLASDYAEAITHVHSMISTTAVIASTIDEKTLWVSYGCEAKMELTSGLSDYVTVTSMPHSMKFEYNKLSFPCDINTEDAWRQLIGMLQGYFNEMMTDSPRSALRKLKAAMYILGCFAGIQDSIVVNLEGIDLPDTE